MAICYDTRNQFREVRRIMWRPLTATGIVLIFLMMMVIGCRGSDQPAGENQPQTAGQDNTAGETSGDTAIGNGAPVEPLAGEFDMSAEVLFDGESRPDDWPGFLPTRPAMKFIEYTNTDEGLHAYGYEERDIYAFSNWVHNMFLEENSMVEWEQDPNNETIERGPEQIFYIVMEGWSLAIELKEIDDETTTFDITMNPA